jgi:hypothetical protein
MNKTTTAYTGVYSRNDFKNPFKKITPMGGKKTLVGFLDNIYNNNKIKKWLILVYLQG